MTVNTGNTKLDRTVSKTKINNSSQPGGTIEYTIKITNSGDYKAQSIQVYGVVPNELTYVPGSLTKNNTITPSAIIDDKYDDNYKKPFNGLDNKTVHRFFVIIDTIKSGQSIQITFRGVIN